MADPRDDSQSQNLPPTAHGAAAAAAANYASVQLANVATAVREVAHPEQIGPYNIQQVIGEGGMGTVYRAEQRHPIRRIVALKLVKLGMDTREVVARFESERQALALMNHPNVAKVFDAGATETGRPYFVMEHVQGEPITAFADRHKLTVRGRLELFIQACEAVQHAHQKAIIHRDIKPTNILVALVDGRPTVKVIDFGVAKALSHRLTERTLFTETGQLVGTPEYMAPEQADGGAGIDVDTRSDVYSLGVVLYELVCGALPFDAKTLRSAGYNEIQRIIREVDPPRPSTRLSKLGQRAQEIARLRQTDLDGLDRQLKRELEWIPLKAMHKERARRYASPTELADDIRNYLTSQPLRAAPDSTTYRLRKFLRRNKRGVAAAGAMAFLLLAGIATTTWQAIVATRQRNDAIAAREAAARSYEVESQQDKFFIEMFRSITPEEARGRPVLMRDVLDNTARRLDSMPPKHSGVEGYVRTLLGGTYRSLGLLDQSLAQLERAQAVDTFNDHGGPNRRAMLFHELGLTYEDLGRLAEAESHLRKALESAQAAGKMETADAIAMQSDLGYVLVHAGKFDEAEQVLADAAQRIARVPDVDLDARVGVANHLAILRQNQGRFAEAESLLRDALKDVVTRKGENDRAALSMTSNLADLLRQQGRAAEAIDMQGRAIEIAAVVFGPDHQDTLTMLNNYALGLDAIGRLDDAERMYKTLIERATRALGDDHASTLLARSNYGLVLMKKGRLDEAEAIFTDVGPRMKQANGPDHLDPILADGNLAQVRVARGDLDGAVAILRELIPHTKRALTAEHPAYAVFCMRLGDILARQGKWSEAEPYLADAYAGAKAQAIPPRIAMAASSYGVCLAKQKKYDQADAPLRDAHENMTALPEPQRAAHPLVLAALVEVAEHRQSAEDAARWRAALAALPAPTSAPTTAPSSAPAR